MKLRYILGIAGLASALAFDCYRQSIAKTLSISELLAIPVAFLLPFLISVSLRMTDASDRELLESRTDAWDWKRELGLTESIRFDYVLGGIFGALFQFFLIWKAFKSE